MLELYFSTFLYVCSKHAVRLASTSINVYIAVYQICALPGGYLADRVLGELMLQRSSSGSSIYCKHEGLCIQVMSIYLLSAYVNICR